MSSFLQSCMIIEVVNFVLNVLVSNSLSKIIKIVMRSWNFWFNSLIFASQHNPPRVVELLMLVLAIAMLVLSTFVPERPAYIVLGLSFVVGASISILIREQLAPSRQKRVTQFTALLLLVVSIYGFADLIIAIK